MRKLIYFCLVLLSISSTAFATADSDAISECVWDKYYTKADALRIKVEELDQKGSSEPNAKKKVSILAAKEKASTELKKIREKKRAFEVLKKENLFDDEEGLKSVFPDEFENCSAD
jgi:hypothetical protein